MTKADLVYNGTRLSWAGRGEFKATSGLPWNENKKLPEKDYQKASEQCTKNQGPVPEGYYRVPLLRDKKPAHTVNEKCGLSRTKGIQKIPAKLSTPSGKLECTFPGWGTVRVPIELIKLDRKAIAAHAGKEKIASCAGRNSFYLHNSTKGYTHGCIEVEPRFFRILEVYSKKHYPKVKYLVLQVAYAAKDTDTFGGTWDGK